MFCLFNLKTGKEGSYLMFCGGLSWSVGDEKEI